jgi:glutamyl-tRNA synthetase
MHVGNIRQALINWLFALKYNGQFILRYDDTDQQRSTAEYAQAIAEDLAWLGIVPHQSFRQSDRFARYQEVAAHLKNIGRLYPCYETPEELDFKRKLQISQGRPPLYDRSALKLTDAQKAAYTAEGRQPHWRFQLVPDVVEWDDLVRGHVRFEGENLSDPVLIRADGVPLYTFASVVDDLDYNVTHIIRGEDHVANTAVQIQLAEAIKGSASAFTFAHLTWLTDSQGQGLSKRLGSLGIRDLSAQGMEPMTLASMLAKLGTSESIEPCYTLEALASTFDFAKFSRGMLKFDVNELWILNQKLLHHMPFAGVCERLSKLGLGYITEAFWTGLRGNIDKLADIEVWWRICMEPLDPVIANEAVTKVAAELLPQEPWDEQAWQNWIGAVKSHSGLAGKALFLPIRLALTAQEHGPELPTLWRSMGYDKVKKRLLGIRA